MRWSITRTSDDPDEQVLDALAMMARYVREDYQHPLVVSCAGEAISGASGAIEQIESVFWYAKRTMLFLEDQSIAGGLASLYRDPVVEVFVRPLDVAIYRSSGLIPYGDCDDFSMWTASLLAACGVPSRFAVVSADPDFPGRWSHVYVVAYPSEDVRIPLDASHGPFPGWEYPARTRLMEYPIFESASKGLLAAAVFATIAAAAVQRGGGSNVRRLGS